MPLSTASFKFFTSSVLASLLLFGSVALASASATVRIHDSVTAVSALSKLKVKPWSSHAGYARSAFSDGWGDIGNCDTRNYILKRDLTSVTWRSGASCLVATGTLKDPYTGKIIKFVRGVKTSLEVQIDHVVALSNAWETGASTMSATSRYNLYNDPLNLLAVDGPTNESKSDSDAAAWLPPNRAYRCAYVARQIAVKTKYRLWITSAEKAAMSSVLNTCAGFKLPSY
jgi:hypothetical protein